VLDVVWLWLPIYVLNGCRCSEHCGIRTCLICVALWEWTVTKWWRTWCGGQLLGWTRRAWHCCWPSADKSRPRTFAGENCTHYGSNQSWAGIQGGWVLFAYVYIEWLLILFVLFYTDVMFLCAKIVINKLFWYCFLHSHGCLKIQLLWRSGISLFYLH